MADRRPVLFRNGTVLTMDDAHTVIQGGDVLVVDDRIAEVGTGLSAPDGALEVDATGGIVMPGMVDTHRHMWQTAMRALRRRLDAHPVLRLVLPRARPAVPSRGHPRRQRAVRVGRPRVRRDHDRRLVPRPPERRPRRRGRRRAAGGAGPVRAGVRQHPGRALGVDGRPGGEVVLRPTPVRRRHARLPDRLRRARRGVVPRGAGVRVRPRARPAAHHPRRGLGSDQRQRHPADARERLHGRGQHLRARRHADRGQLPAHRRVGRLRLRLDGVRAERRAGVPAHLAGTPSRHPGVAVPRHQRVVEQRPVHRHADDARRRPLARAPRGARRRRHGHQLLPAGRAGRRLGDPRWRTGARP